MPSLAYLAAASTAPGSGRRDRRVRAGRRPATTSAASTRGLTPVPGGGTDGSAHRVVFLYARGAGPRSDRRDRAAGPPAGSARHLDRGREQPGGDQLRCGLAGRPVPARRHVLGASEDWPGPVEARARCRARPRRSRAPRSELELATASATATSAGRSGRAPPPMGALPVENYWSLRRATARQRSLSDRSSSRGCPYPPLRGARHDRPTLARQVPDPVRRRAGDAGAALRRQRVPLRGRECDGRQEAMIATARDPRRSRSPEARLGVKIETVDEEMLRQMAPAGCYRLARERIPAPR